MKLRDLNPGRFFLDAWRELDEESARYKAQHPSWRREGLLALYIYISVAVSLTLQDYFGGPDTFFSILGFIDNPLSAQRDPTLWALVGWLAPKDGSSLYLKLDASGYLDLWNLGYWASWRVFGFLIIPLIALGAYPGIVKLTRFIAVVFKLGGEAPAAKPWLGEQIRDDGAGAPGRRLGLGEMGLGVRGFGQHAWVYGVFFAPVLVAVIIVSFTEEFSTYYPFYSEAHRSIFDFAVWELFYIAQFFALEFFFRGFMLQPLRRVMGSSAIFAMMIPYVMIHYGKPLPECFAAIIAGIVLGTLAIRTRSIWAGFLIHVSVALSMDIAAIWQTHW